MYLVLFIGIIGSMISFVKGHFIVSIMFLVGGIILGAIVSCSEQYEKEKLERDKLEELKEINRKLEERP